MNIIMNEYTLQYRIKNSSNNNNNNMTPETINFENQNEGEA